MSRDKIARVQSDLYQVTEAHPKEFSSYVLGSTFIDLTQVSAQSFSTGDLHEIHGDWLYVDPSSVGAVLCTLFSEQDDSKAICLNPGQVIDWPFDRIRIFSTPASVPGVLPVGALSNPGIRLQFGKGECPFDSVSNAQGSAQPIAYAGSSFSAQTAASATYSSVLVPSGALVDVSSDASQVTGAAETSLLRQRLAITLVNGNVIYVTPDSEYAQDVATAGAGTARVQSNWSSQRLPRGAASIAVVTSNYGNALTNNISAGSSGQNVLVG